MIRGRDKNAGIGRQGFTMVEVMLTLCVLAALAAICWPAFSNSFVSYRLRAAANRVRAEWVRARAEAMSADTVYVFRYSVGGAQFSVESVPDPDAIAEESLGDGMGGSTGVSDPATRSCKSPGTLSDGVVFGEGQIAPDPRAATVAAEMEPSNLSNETDPILFFPDGTTSTALMRLQNERGRSIDLSLRGLTGVVTIGEVGSGDQPPP